MCLFPKAFAGQPDESEIEHEPNSETESEDERKVEEEADSGHGEAKQADHSGIKCSTFFPNFSFLPFFIFFFQFINQKTILNKNSRQHFAAQPFWIGHSRHK